MEAPAEHPAAGMSGRLVAAGVRLLAEQGPGAVQTRRLAREVGASTTAVYHYFGSMPQLLAAMIDEGFRRLDVRLAAVPVTDDPVTDIGRLALAYRSAARENPHLYDLMFGLSAPGGHRPQERDPAATSESGRRAYAHLAGAVSRAIHAGRIRDRDPNPVAAQFWSTLHGYVTLELAGHLDHLDGLRQVFIPLSIHLLIGLGDSPERAAHSAAPIDDSW